MVETSDASDVVKKQLFFPSPRIFRPRHTHVCLEPSGRQFRLTC